MKDLYFHRLGLLSPDHHTGRALRSLDELVSMPDPKMCCSFKALLMAGG